MAISVPVPKEITEYKEKLMFGLSGRQLIFSALAAVVAIGIGVLCTVLGVSMTITGYVVMLAAAPLMAVGFIRKNNMPFEKYLFLILRSKMGQNQLAYKTELLIDAMPDIDVGQLVTERKSKHGTAKKGGLGRNGGRPVHEYGHYCQITAQGRQRKRKSARRKIKAARQECRAAERRAAAAAAGRSRP